MIAGYYGMVSLADDYCGLVLDALDRLGIREQTIVIWTVDHGDQMGEHRMFLKFCMYEGSVHVPLFISVPGIRPARRSELVEQVDLFPRFATWSARKFQKRCKVAPCGPC